MWKNNFNKIWYHVALFIFGAYSKAFSCLMVKPPPGIHSWTCGFTCGVWSMEYKVWSIKYYTHRVWSINPQAFSMSPFLWNSLLLIRSKLVDCIRQFRRPQAGLRAEDAPGMWRGVRNRQEGRINPHSFARSVRTDRLSSLDLSNRKEIVSPHRGAINSLQVSYFISLSLFVCNFIEQLVVASLIPRACVSGSISLYLRSVLWFLPFCTCWIFL